MTIITDTRESNEKIILGVREKLDAADFKITTKGGLTILVERKTYSDLYSSLFGQNKNPNRVDLREQLYRMQGEAQKVDGFCVLLIEKSFIFKGKGKIGRMKQYARDRLEPNIYTIWTDGAADTVRRIRWLEKDGDHIFTLRPRKRQFRGATPGERALSFLPKMSSARKPMLESFGSVRGVIEAVYWLEFVDDWTKTQLGIKGKDMNQWITVLEAGYV